MEKAMKVVILEDEVLASRRLEKMLRKELPTMELMATLRSVESAIKWCSTNEKPDLIFADIQLGDGLSFEIFETCHITTPVIFTTAFNEYAIRAFKHNSIDYLLKPIDEEELHGAIEKMLKGKAGNQPEPNLSPMAIAQAMRMITSNFKTRFLIKVGEHLRPIDIAEVTHFYSEAKDTFLVNLHGRSYALDYSLDQLEQLVDPEKFFRISRKVLVSKAAITDVVVYSGSRLKVKAGTLADDDAVVSRERVSDFKVWLER